MKRYQKANEEIRPDEALNAKAAGARSAAPRRVIALATAAALLVGTLTAAAVFLSRDPADDLPPVTTGAPIETDAPADPIAPVTTGAPVETNAPETAETISGAMPLQLTYVSHPEQAQYPLDDIYMSSPEFQRWREEHNARLVQPEGYDEGLHEASVALMQQFLTSTEKTAGQNRVLSPLNLYLALAMLTEATDTTSRAALLELLGADSVDTLRQRVASIWDINYTNDGRVTSLLAASLWLDSDLSYRADTLERMARHHFAESYQGQMGSAELDQLLRNWLNENTGNLLTEQANNVSLAPETVLALATTIYFKGTWEDKFNERLTADDTFHAVSGDVTAPFMHDSSITPYYRGENFGAIYRDLGDGKMWLILPDEGTTPDQLITEGEIFSLTRNYARNWSNQKRLRVNLSLPKFDVVADTDLIAGLAALGLGDLFNPAAADFSPITDDPNLQGRMALSQAKHAARVIIDEEGCEAAAFTILVATATGMITADEIDFVLDRPFIFLVTGSDHATLFAGVVEMP